MIDIAHTHVVWLVNDAELLLIRKSLATWVASMHIHALICSAHDEIKEKKRAGQKCWDYIHPCL